MGRWWHKDKKFNDDTKEILFVECKLQSNVNVKKVLSELKDKSKFVQWNNEKRNRAGLDAV